jgi:hypothetical protein
MLINRISKQTKIIIKMEDINFSQMRGMHHFLVTNVRASELRYVRLEWPKDGI